jgi:hypothetical protein
MNIATTPNRRTRTSGPFLRIGTALRLLPLLVFGFGASPLRADQSGDFTYTNHTTYVTITGYTGSGGAVVIPSTIVGLPVTVIGNSSFQSKTSITSVTIPSTVTSIGTYAFSYCSGLASITIPAGVSSIGNAALTGCTNLITISVDAASLSYSSAGGVLFNKTQTTLIQYPAGKTGGYVIPSGVTHIDGSAFQSCAGLSSVTLPASLTNIGSYAFYFTGLGSVTIPAAVTNIGGQAFGGCRFMTAITVDAANSTYSSAGGALLNKTQTALIQCPGGQSGSYAIPASVTIIESYAFYYCQFLTGVSIPSSVTTIDYYAFGGCSAITSFSIPASVNSIGESAFYDCSLLTDISVAASNPNYSSSNGVLFNKTQTTLIQCPAGKSGSYAIPSGVITVSNNAFFGCDGLTGVTFTSSVTTIGSQAFFYCTGLVSVTIPASVTTIRSRAFVYCYGLTEAVFAGNAPAIMEYGVFDSAASGFTIKFYSGATGFTTPTWQGYSSQMLTGGGGATLADAMDAPSLAFTTGGSASWVAQSLVTHDGVDAAVSGNIGNSQETWMQTTVNGPGTISFWWAVETSSGLNDILEFYVNGALQSGAISGSVPWQQKTYVLGAGSHTLRWSYSKDPFDNWFPDAAWVDQVVWTPGGGNPADFTYTSNGGSITITGYIGSGGAVSIPSTISGLPVTTIGNNAFSFEPTITSVTIPDSVTSIGDYAFGLNYSLSSVSLGTGLQTIGFSAFSGLGATSITLPPSLTTIGDYAFNGSSLTSMNIPASVTAIGVRALDNCHEMEIITVAAANPNYSSLDGVLFDKDRFTLIKYPASKPGNYLIPDEVFVIAEKSFGGYGLTSVTISENVTLIDSTAFEACLGLTSITVVPGNPVFSSLNGVLFDESFQTLLVYPGGKTGSYAIPAGVLGVAERAFSICWNLTGVTIPEGVISIGDVAFYYCEQLETLTLPASLASLGDAVFAACDSLLNVHVTPGGATYGSENGVLFNADRSVLLYFPVGRTGSYSIPQGTQRIEAFAFGNSELSEVSVPTSVTQLGDSAFIHARELESLIFAGNAPLLGTDSLPDSYFAHDEFTIYFYEGASGYTVPTWYGYPSQMLPGGNNFANWAAVGGLIGNNALPGAIPHGDGVPNLLKFAFGLNPSGPDARRMVPGDTVGLPTAYLHQNGGTVWRVEYLRRKNSGLTYTPKKSTTLGNGSLIPLTGTQVVSEIVGFPDWQRVIVDEPYNPATTPRMFTTVEVTGQ